MMTGLLNAERSCANPSVCVVAYVRVRVYVCKCMCVYVCMHAFAWCVCLCVCASFHARTKCDTKICCMDGVYVSTVKPSADDA